MNYLKLFFSPIVFVSLSLVAQGIQSLDVAAIDKKAEVIQKKVTRDTYLKYAAGGLIAARVLYAAAPYTVTPAWQLARSFFDKKLDVQDSLSTPISNAGVSNTGMFPVSEQQLEKSGTLQPVEKPEVPYISWSEWLRETFVDAKEQITVKNICTLSKDSTIFIGKWGLSVCGNTLLGFAMQKLYKQLIYPDTLRWYVYTHVPCRVIIKQMKETITLLSDESLTSDQIDYNRQILHESCCCLARHGESICAYMVYKSKKLDAQLQPMAERSQRYLFGYYNDWLKRIGQQLDQETIQCDEVSKLITSYTKELFRQLECFSIIEEETDSDKYMINEQIQLSMAGSVAVDWFFN